MFNIELIRNNLIVVKDKLKARNFDVQKIDIAYDLDIKNRELKTQVQSLLAEKNRLSKEIGFCFQQKQVEQAELLQSKVKSINDAILDLEIQQKNINSELLSILQIIPNLCDDSVPIGQDETSNVAVKYWGTPRSFDFNPLPHWELGNKLKLIDLECATKLSGSRYALYTMQGARLYRALQQFTLDHNISHGYQEMLPSVVLLEDSLYATGQLPKFKEDVYGLSSEDMQFYLSPTAEVQLVNLHRNEIVQDLPKRYTANTPCFRSEAGSAGKDTKGVLRLHQFYKSELVVLCDPNESWDEHEKITRTAELILEKLNLPYRRLLLSTGDTGFSSAKTFDLEVWLPCYQEYKEISSCSNCLDFQARRASIRMRNNKDENVLVHTLNGSSLAIDRLWVAVVENYQQYDGSIQVPDALIPYMNGISKITNN